MKNISNQQENIRPYVSLIYLKTLSNNEGESLERYSTNDIPRKFLKKCRWCGFKKRKCLMNPKLCSALHKQCYRCSKRGHFPKSGLRRIKWCPVQTAGICKHL